MSPEYEAMMNRAAQNTISVGGGGAAAPLPLSEDANSALAAADELHNLLDSLEMRLFGPMPQPNTGGATEGPPVFASQIRATRQRLEYACSRVNSLCGRL